MSTATPTAASNVTKFVRVPTCILKTLDQTCVDLFLQHDPKEPHVLYRDAGYPLSQDRAQGLVETCDEALFVRASDYANFSKDLANSLEKSLEDESLAPTERYEVLQFAVSLEIEQSMRMVNSDSYVANTKTLGKQISSLLNEGEVLPKDLYQIVRHDFHTFVHVTNVAGYATLLAKELGISDPSELERISVGGLLHDIGKRYIPPSILTKTGALTTKEWGIIREHPLNGYKDLCHRESINHGQLMMTYQHHEHLNGNGYPVGVASDEIHPWAKMLAVVDVFDALTGDRPYRTPATAEEAIQFIESKAGTQFDKEMVQCWASAMQQ